MDATSETSTSIPNDNLVHKNKPKKNIEANNKKNNTVDIFLYKYVVKNQDEIINKKQSLSLMKREERFHSNDVIDKNNKDEKKEKDASSLKSVG